MNLINIIIPVCSILFLAVGADKFGIFIDPPCSLMGEIPILLWHGIGILQMAAGILIWFSTYRKYITGFFLIFILVFSTVHISQNTFDIGGALFMATLLGLLVWNPRFINGNIKSAIFK